MRTYSEIIDEIKRGITVPNYKSPSTITIPSQLIMLLDLVYGIKDPNLIRKYDLFQDSIGEDNVVYLAVDLPMPSEDDNGIRILYNQIMLFGKPTSLIIINSNLYNNAKTKDIILAVWDLIIFRYVQTGFSIMDKTIGSLIFEFAPVVMLFDILYEIFFLEEVVSDNITKFSDLCEQSVIFLLEMDINKEWQSGGFEIRNLFYSIYTNHPDKLHNVIQALANDVKELGAPRLLDESLLVNAIMVYQNTLQEIYLERQENQNKADHESKDKESKSSKDDTSKEE